MVELAVITPSYRADFELAIDLCRSMDRHLRCAYEHILIIPRRDLSRFKVLEGPNRRILAAEDIVKPAGLYRLPLPNRLRAPPLINLRIGEQWVGPGGHRVTGWLVQQIIKLSAPQISEAPIFIFADSDVVLFRDTSLLDFMLGDTLVLHEHHRGLENASHQKWRENARQLLGLTPEELSPPTNYIGMLVGWRRKNVLLLQQAIAKTASQSWQSAILKLGDVSEYILYGMFCRYALKEASLHTYRDVDNSLSIWTTPAGDLEEEALGRLTESQVCLHLQSTLSIPLQTRRKIIDRVCEVVRRDDSASINGGGA